MEGVDLELLRDWLWEATERKLARATIARRAAAARSLTAWLHRTERVATDPGARLRAPKAQGRLPRVVGNDQLRGLFEGLEARASEDDASALRDLALLELIYGSALRVSEACGTDVDDVDLGGGTAQSPTRRARGSVQGFSSVLSGGLSALTGGGGGSDGVE